MKVFDDPELEEKLDHLDALDGPATEYDTLRKELLPLFTNKNDYVIGKWLVRGTEITRRMKAQPAKEAKTTKYWHTSFERIEQDGLKPGGEND